MATKYDELLQSPQITAKANLISFLRPSPKWVVQNSVPADWVLKKQDIESYQIGSNLSDSNNHTSSLSRSKKQKQVSIKIKGSISTNKVGVISKSKKSEKESNMYIKAKTAAGLKTKNESDDWTSSQKVIRSLFGILGKVVSSMNKKAKVKRLQ